ncbi:glycoside hydrolase family 92 protein [Exidia glandulosa HHB12029]|uniref:Glycoside hydrolase family 92 protein n=1 Tax=Exidia glandulosa HHB12029 TaxID=1314781 RepID=A0A165MBG5_EXIGL|nr:glycoside hydrolase family 92 protein [Exidia glandulosa HHB12029]
MTALWRTFYGPYGPAFFDPPSAAVDYVDPMIGNGGDTPNGSGGMIPSVAPPFGMTRWTAMTRQNYVSVHPYNYSQTSIHGFIGTHQPAIWMGEQGQVVVMPGQGDVTPDFDERGMPFSHAHEISTASYYKVELGDSAGITAEHSATSRVGHLRFTFHNKSATPYVLLQATRKSVIRWWEPDNLDDNLGDVHIDPSRREISGRNPERQDRILGPNKAEHCAGYFVARFDTPFHSFGTASGSTLSEGEKSKVDASEASAFVRFAAGTQRVDVRIGVSFISIAQARANLDAEISDGTTLEKTAYRTRTAWAEKLDRLQVEGGDVDRRKTFYTAAFHALQYPYEQSEGGRYYSGYDDSVHVGDSYTGYSIWDTYRAEWGWLILLAPERIPGMIQSMLQDYKEGGWLPMWKSTCCESNIMIATHADSLIAEAMVKGVEGFNTQLAYEAILKDATVPPENDTTIQYADREEALRAGLTSVYEQSGYVANELHTESASRTLGYAYDDYAVSIVADIVGKHDAAQFFRARSQNYRKIFNQHTGFMEARLSSGDWAGPDEGWTEGDKWAYTMDVVHDIPGLIELKGGNESFVEFMDEHFDGDHTNEPSHHIPYLYALAGAPWKAQERIRAISRSDYNSTPVGLSGNEDCGQMSAWFLYSALGFYSVNPASGEYVIGAPTTFDRISIALPGRGKLVVNAPGAGTKPYVRSLRINGQPWSSVVVPHHVLVQPGGVTFDFEMSEVPEQWGV